MTRNEKYDNIEVTGQARAASVDTDSATVTNGISAASVDVGSATVTNGISAASVDTGDVRTDRFQDGENPAETISGTGGTLSFTGTETRDIHDSTDITLTNTTTASVTEDATVNYYEGIDATGTLIASETQSVTVAAGASSTVTFLTGDFGLGLGDYHIEATTATTNLTVDSIAENTLGAQYITEQDAEGDLVTTDHQGRERARYDAASGAVSFPSVDTDSATVTNAISAASVDAGSATITNGVSAGSVNTNSVSVGTGAPVSGLWGDSGETVLLDKVKYGPINGYSFINTTWDEVGGAKDRDVADYTNYNYTNITNERLVLTIYRLQETTGTGRAQVSVKGFGTAPATGNDPIEPGLVIEAANGADTFRVFATAPVNMANYGQWTPALTTRALDTGEGLTEGFASVSLVGDIV